MITPELFELQTPEDVAEASRLAKTTPGISYERHLESMLRQRANADIAFKARVQNTTVLDQAYAEWNRLTKDASSPFYGQDPQTFAKETAALGSDRYQILNHSKPVRGLLGLGNFFDSEFQQSGISENVGNEAANLAMVFSDDPNTVAATRAMGEEMPAALGNLLPAAIPGVGVGVAAGLSGLDSYTDARESGRQGVSAAGAGALSTLTVGVMPATGKLFEKFGTDVAIRLAGNSVAKAAASLRSGVLNIASRTAIRETGQLGVGVGFDVADVGLFDDQRTLADLTKSEYLLPMLLSNGITVLGQEVISTPTQILRNRQSKTPPTLPGVEAHLAEQQRRVAELRELNQRYDAAYAFERMADIAAGPRRQLYDEELYAHYYSNTDTSTAAAHWTHDSFDLTRIQPWSLAPDQKTGDFLVRLSTAARELDMPLSKLATISQSSFNAIRSTTDTDATATLRAYNLIQDKAARLYRDIPSSLHDHANASKLWQVHKTRIQRGLDQMVYTNKTDDIVAIAQNNTVTSASPQLAIYKGGARLTGTEANEILLAHGDGIRSGVAQYQDSVRNVYNKAIQRGGVFAEQNFDPQVGQAVNEIFKGLGINEPVILLSQRDLDLPEYSAFKGAFGQSSREYGKMLRLGGDTMPVNLIWTKDGQGRNNIVTLMHEVGHVVEQYYGKQFPQALQVLKQEAQKAFGKLDLKSMEELRAFGPNHPEFLRKFKKAKKGMNYDFSEYFANQFSKWVLQPDAKPASVLDRYTKSIVDALRSFWNKFKETLGWKPSVEFKDWMDHMSRKFYQNIMWNNDTLFRSLAETYQLGDSGTDMLARKFYENSDPAFQKLVSSRLADWHTKGRGDDPGHVISQAESDWQKIKDTSLPDEPENTKASQVASLLFDPAKLKVSQGFINRVVNKFQTLNRDGVYVDAYQAGSIVRTIWQRWSQGELPGQKTVPRVGGEEKLWSHIEKELNSLKNPLPAPLTLKANGNVDNSGAPLRNFSDYNEAMEVADGLRTMAKYEQYQIEVQSTGKQGYKVVFKWSPDAHKVSFDEQWVNSEMDEAVGDAAAQAKWSVDELLMAAPEDGQGRFREAFTNFAGSMPEDVAIDLGNLGLYTPKEASSRLGAAIMKAIGNGKAPESLLRSLDEVTSVASSDINFHSDLRAIGKDLGGNVQTVDDLVGLVVNKLTTGKDLTDFVRLAPAPFDRLLRELGSTVDQYGKVTEFGARLGSTLGLHEQSLEQLKGARGAGLKLLTADEATQRLADLAQFSSPGGAEARLTKLARKGSKLRRVYEATIAPFTQIAANNPLLQPFDEAVHMEHRDVFRMMNDTLIPLHADDPNVLVHVDKEGKSFATVRGDSALNETFDDIVRLQQIKGAGFNQLLNAGDAEATALFASVPGDKQGAVMDLLERMQRVQINNVQLRALEARQLDRLNLATFLVRAKPEMTPKQAHAFIDTLYATPVQETSMVLEGAGIEPELAGRLLAYKDGMDMSTTEMVSKLQQAPWYVSEQRMGRFLVRFYDNKAKRTGAVSFDDRDAAVQWVKEQDKGEITISKKGVGGIEDQQQKYGTRVSNDFREVLDSTIKAKQAQVSQMFGEDEELVKSVNDALQDIFQGVDSSVTALSKGTLNINRKFSSGRDSLDMLDQQKESIRRGSVGMTRARTNAIYNLYKQDGFFQTPEGSRQMRLAEQHLQNFREADTRVGADLTKFGFAMTLAGNLSSMMTEVLTVPVVIAPLLRERGAGFVESFGIPKRVGAEFTKALVSNNGVFKDALWNKVLDRAKRENALTARHLVDIDSDRVLNDLDTNRVVEGGVVKKYVHSVADGMYRIGSKIYQPAAYASGVVSLLSAFETARKYNPSGDFDVWYNQAMNDHTRAQGAGGKAARPVGLFSTKGAARTLSQMAYNLQGFANNQVANLIHFAKKGWMDDPQFTVQQRKHARAAFRQAMATTIGLVGIAGIPLAQALSVLAEKTLGFNPEKELEKFVFENAPGDETERAFITNLAMRGTSYAAGLPFDLQSRMSVGGLFALNNYDGFNMGQVFGVPGGFAQQAFEAVGAIPRGQGMSEAVDMLPAAVRRAVQLWVNDGKIMRKGEVMLEPTAIETAFAAMGFNPTRMRQSRDMYTAKEYFDKKETAERKETVQRAVEMLEGGQIQEAQQYIATQADRLMGLRSYDESKRIIEQQVAQGYAKLNVPQANDPGRTREAPMLNALYGGGNQNSQVQDYVKQMEAKLLMGAPAKWSPQRLRTARVADRLMADQADLSPFLAKTYAQLYDQQVLPNPFAEGNSAAVRPGLESLGSY